MKLLMLATRNLFRNLRRTLITLAAVAFGLVMIHLTITLQTGSYRDMITQGVGALAGHVVVQAEGYQEERDADLLVHDATAIESELAAAFPDAVVAPRIFLGGLLNSPTNSVGVALSGVEPAAEAAVQDLDGKVIQGTWLDDDDRGILIGTGMAESLGVSVGDKLVYMGQYGDSTEMTSRMFRVKGIFRTGSAEMDGFMAIAPIGAARDLLGGADVAHQITVHLRDPDRADAATEHARQLLSGRPGIVVLHWRQAIPEIYAMIRLDRQYGDLILIILGVIVTMGVLNTVLMSALERTREFGVMLAIGLKPPLLAGVMLLEGTVLGVIGAILGLILGIASCYPMVHYGIDMTALTGGQTMETGGIVLSSVIHGAWNPLRMAYYTAGAIVFTTLAALYPAIYVARLQPVAAMRHV